MKRLLKQNHGMTLMEILVALTLLMIVIVGTTPVMLSAFDGLYTAGEFTQDTYEAKSEVEDKLATRNTKDIYNPGFQVNFQNIGEVANINARRAVSSLYGSLETLFSNGKVHIAIVSAKNVNDDYADDGYHEVIIQTSNLDFGDDVKNKYDAATKISLNDESKVEDGDADRKKIIDLTFIIPNKQKTDKEGNVAGDAEIYTYLDNKETQEKECNLANIYKDPEGNECEVDHITGRITVKINGFDFTQSPIKIRASYLDENNKKQVTETYLFVDQPTIMAVGETNKTDSEGNRIAYYTTPGVVEVPVKGSTTGAKEKVFEIYPRTMRTENATGTQAIPEKTIFKSVNWITESTTSGDLTNNAYASSYYVITGTNGAIYRTYAMKGIADEGKIIGKVNLHTTDAQFNGKDQLGVDVSGVLDKDIILADKYSTLVYPAFWGGDFSHIFMFTAYGGARTYKDEDVWHTEQDDTGKGVPGYYSNKANFSYWYSGYSTGSSWSTQNSRIISYILTEIPYALRVGGYLDEAGNFDQSINRIWERPIIWNADGTFNSPDPIKKTKKKGTAGKFTGNYYKKPGENFTRCTIVEASKNLGWLQDNNWMYDDDFLNEVPTYFDRYSDNATNLWGDDTFAQLRLKGLTTISPTFLYDHRNDSFSKDTDRRFGYNSQTNQAKINITDSVYIPGTGMFYVGNVAAYGVINQLDNVDTSENYAATIRTPDDADSRYNRGGITTYYVMGNDTGTATTIHRYSSADKGRDESGTNNNLNIFQNKSQVAGDGVSVNGTESRDFFVTRTNGGTDSQLFNDLFFTLGFASNREMVYTNIVYGETAPGVITESFKSYEGYYFLSHWDDVSANHYPTLAINDLASKSGETAGSNNGNTTNVTEVYRNSSDNDFYNVWFPGEMYNLTKVAVKDGVIVSVGYAVSGSTYTWINPIQKTNGSTALGNIHNDGVLSAMVSGQDTALKNLLYFKDTKNFDKTSLTTLNSNNYTQLSGIGDNTGYGTHARDSVQFTTVDLSVEKTDVVKDGTTGEIIEWTDRYYAYYADNKGRVYRSLIATKNDDGSVEMVSHIADQANNGKRSAPSYMEEQKIGDKDIGDYFEKITSIKADGGLVIVSGYSKEGFCIAVGEVSEEGNAPTWKIVKGSGCDATYKVNDMLIRDGYVYIAGSKNSGGFVFAVEMAALEIAANNGTVSGKTATTAGALYAIAGQ